MRVATAQDGALLQNPTITQFPSLWNPEVQCRVHDLVATGTYFKQYHLAHVLTPYFFLVHSDITFFIDACILNINFVFFSTILWTIFLYILMHATCLSTLILLQLNMNYKPAYYSLFLTIIVPHFPWVETFSPSSCTQIISISIRLFM